MTPGARSRPRLPAIVIALTVIVADCGTVTRTSPDATTPRAPAASPSAPPGPSSGGPSLPPVASRNLRIEVDHVTGGFDRPLAAVAAGDGSGRLFVVEQGGRILIVRDGRVAGTPFLDIADRISDGGERGLLGLAFHPRFPDDPRLFVDYTEADRGDTVVSSFRLAGGDADRADPASEQRLLRIGQPFPNHNGGALAFGSDGMLLIATGDGGSGGDPQDNGQRTDTLLGKILRIDVDATEGDRGFGIPADNPFAAGGGEPEIWLTGLRNPWRMSVDRATGDLWIGDVGQGSWEEIDVQRAGAPGGTNFGWSRMEGFHCRAQECGGGFAQPVAEYGHDVGCTVIGGFVYRGAVQAGLEGAYLFGDYCSGQLWVIDARVGDRQDPLPVGGAAGQVSSFGEDESGELYVTLLDSGALLHVVVADA
ncbi:MAG TPA: PQQ-dependent sugar dehydrogenase [Candidatus Limnocylindrales bacterium]|jgi:glucose/arabinose dehydrogenase